MTYFSAIEFLNTFAFILLGAFFAWVFYYNSINKHLINQRSSDDYNALSDNLTDVIIRLSSMSRKLNTLILKNQNLHADNVKLANELHRMREACRCGSEKISS